MRVVGKWNEIVNESKREDCIWTSGSRGPARRYTRGSIPNRLESASTFSEEHPYSVLLVPRTRGARKNHPWLLSKDSTLRGSQKPIERANNEYKSHRLPP